MTKRKSVSSKMLLDVGNSASRCAMCRDAIGRGIGKSAFNKIKSLAKRTAVRMADLSADEKALLKQAAKDIVKSSEPGRVLGNIASMVSDKFGSKMAGKGYQCGSGFSSSVGRELTQSGSGVFDDILGVMATMDPTGLLRTGVMAKTALGLGKPEGAGVNITGEKIGRGTLVAGESVGRGRQDGKGFLGIDFLPRPSDVADTFAGMVGVPPGVTSGFLKSVGLGKEKKEKKARKPSRWVEHVKAYAKEHGVSYKEAMSKAKATYKK